MAVFPPPLPLSLPLERGITRQRRLGWAGAINRRGHGPDKLMSLLDAERVLGRVCVTLLVH